MKVVLIKDTEKLGKRGDVKEVAEGFARNFLFPEKYAVVATVQAIRDASRIKHEIQKQKHKKKASLQSLSGVLQGYSLEISAKAGPAGQLYGGISAQQISKALRNQNMNVEEKRIRTLHIKTLGTHKVVIDCGEGKVVSINVIITPAN